MRFQALAVEIPSEFILFLHFCSNNLWHTHTRAQILHLELASAFFFALSHYLFILGNHFKCLFQFTNFSWLLNFRDTHLQPILIFLRCFFCYFFFSAHNDGAQKKTSNIMLFIRRVSSLYASKSESDLKRDRNVAILVRSLWTMILLERVAAQLAKAGVSVQLFRALREWERDKRGVSIGFQLKSNRN